MSPNIVTMYLLLAFALFMTCVVLIREAGRRSGFAEFLIAGRRLGGFVGAMSIAASWIWAPAIFISTKIGYEYGLSALVWFCIPNMLALVIFAPLASKVRAKVPEGYSYIDYIKNLGGGYWQLQLTLQLCLQVVIFSIQLTAGASMLSALGQGQYQYLVVAMALTPLAYSTVSGLRASVFTDSLQYALIATGACVIVFNFPFNSISSETNNYEFSPFDMHMLLEFGISSAIGLLVAIFADQQQWQRAFAARQPTLIRTFCTAGLLHLLVTAMLGIFGWLVAQHGFRATNKELVGVEFVEQVYGPVFVYVYMVMALCALVSTLDSGLCAFSSLWSTQVKPSTQLRLNRLAMLALSVCGACVASLHVSLLTLWFIAGTIRLSSFAPTVASIVKRDFKGLDGTIAIAAGLLCGIPVFGYGSLTSQPMLRTLGMILAVAVSSIALLVSSAQGRCTSLIKSKPPLATE